jgi:hypothetical protein
MVKTPSPGYLRRCKVASQMVEMQLLSHEPPEVVTVFEELVSQGFKEDKIKSQMTTMVLMSCTGDDELIIFDRIKYIELIKQLPKMITP